MVHPQRKTAITAALAAVYALAALVAIVTRAGGTEVVRAVDDTAQGLAAATAAVAAASIARGRGRPGRVRVAWAVLAAGLACWAAGQAVWCWFEIVRGVPAPFPSLADAGFLSFSVLGAVGLCLLQDQHAAGRLRSVLDGLIVAGSLLDVSWSTALGATVHGARFTFATAVSVAYPVGDIVLLTMAVQMLSRARSRRAPLGLLTLGIAGLALADSAFTYFSAVGRYRTGDLIDLGWVGGFGLVGVAAAALARAEPAAAEAPEEVAPNALVWLPYVALVVAGCAVLALHLAGHKVDGVEIRVTAGVLLCVVARQSFYLRDNNRLLRAVEVREQELVHRASHDALTGLPNRALLHEQVAEALAAGSTAEDGSPPGDPGGRRGRAGRPGAALLFCDLDDFKIVNDTLGHRAGDDLLQRVAERMREAVRPGDLLARLGGDEFAVLVAGADPVRLAERLLEALQAPFDLDGRLAQVHASIGVRLIAEGETASPSEVLADADVAMYAAKRDGKGGVQVYDDRFRHEEVADLALQQDLSAALVAGKLNAAYQPVADPRTGRVEAVEVLARWERGGRPVPPAVFVPVAERLGLMSMLTDAMLEAGLAQLETWTRQLRRRDLRVSVNVSATELRPDRLLFDRVADALARHRVEPGRLVLEVTESAVAPDEAAAGDILGLLRALGCRVALDDFGVGQSSLARLHRFPIDVVKLDASIVRDSESDAGQGLILDSVTALGEGLGLQVVVEGVETAAQLGRLQAAPGRPLAQGYALAPPLPAEALAELLVRGVGHRAGASPAPVVADGRDSAVA